MTARDLPYEPLRGVGRIHPFGTAVFIRDFLDGRGPQYGVDRIDPRLGAPQATIHGAYKEALLFYTAQELATIREEKDSAAEGRGFSPDKAQAMVGGYLHRLPRKLTFMRYHSFVQYFAMLKSLGWVEPTGQVEPSEFQDFYAEAQSRIFYRLTAAGRRAPLQEIANPLKVLYPDFDAEYYRQKRSEARETAEARAAKALALQGTGPPRPPVAAPRLIAPAPPRIAPPAPPTAIPPFEMADRPGRRAAQQLVAHLRRLEDLDVDTPEVDQELQRLEGDLQGWLDQVEEAISREEKKEEPTEDRLDQLQEQRDALEEAVSALGDRDVGLAIDALDRAFPAGAPRAGPAPPS